MKKKVYIHGGGKISNVFIHVGLPKTATTFLQKEIFAKFEDVNYIGRWNIKTELKKDTINIISDETLYGCADATYNNNIDIRQIILDKLKLMYPNAKIIVGIREKEKWKKSLYNHYVKAGGYLPYDKWLTKINVDYFDMESYIKDLKKKFKLVYVYNFDDIKNQNKFVENLCNFMELPIPMFTNKLHNVSLTKMQLKILRILNRVIYSKEYNPKGIIPHMILIKIFRKIR